MPTELNGTYWTIQEIAEYVGLEYSGVFRRIMREGLDTKLVCIGTRTYLVPDDVAQDIIELLSIRVYTASYTAKKTGVSMGILKEIVQHGFPSTEDKGRLAFYADHLGVIQAAFQRVARSGKYEREQYGEATAKLALKILERMEQEDAAVSDD